MKIVYRPQDQVAYDKLVAEGINPLVAKVFSSRGFSSLDDAKPNLDDIPDCAELKGCMEMAEILVSIIKSTKTSNPKKIVVVADYDADGATACSLVVHGLRKYGVDVSYVVPDRMVEGYGLSPAVAKRAFETFQPDYLMTVDNGISAVEGVEAANALGMKVLVTDHHLPGPRLPNAEVIVNPNQPGCTFPSKALAGCGVAWYVLRAMEALIHPEDEENTLHRNAAMSSKFPNGITQADPDLVSAIWSQICLTYPVYLTKEGWTVSELLPFVAIGTVADVVSIADDLNRTLVQAGMNRIRSKSTFWGIEWLFVCAEVTPREASTADIAFGVGPRINAAGRIDNMSIGINCLTSDNCVEARLMAEELHQLNRQRREIEWDIMIHAWDLAAAEYEKGKKSIVLHFEDWHQGVVGISAGRIKEKYWLPSWVIGETGDDGLAKASGRSIDGFHMKHTLDEIAAAHPGLIAKYGGHAMAAGMSIHPDNIEKFKELFEAAAVAKITPEMLHQEIVVDAVIDVVEMSNENIRAVNRESWGAMFNAPQFYTEFEVVSSKQVRDGTVLLMELRQGANVIKGIKYRHSGDAPTGKIGIVYTVDLDHYRNMKNPMAVINHLVAL